MEETKAILEESVKTIFEALKKAQSTIWKVFIDSRRTRTVYAMVQ